MILVLDCGTSALKATVFSEDGVIAAQAPGLYGGVSGAVTFSADDWWQAATMAVAQLDCRGVTAIALTGTMENLIALDGRGAPIGEVLVYSNACGQDSLERRAAALTALGAAEICGNAPEPLMTAFKLDWLREERPEAFARVRHILPGSKDYLAFRLTGAFATDPVCAATTGLMDMATRIWSPMLIDAFGFDPELLPAILPADAVVGPLLPAAAAALGLQAGLPVINGCGDGGATTLGSGAAKENDVSLYLGTSGWVARVASAYDGSPRPYYRLPHPAHDGLIEIAPVLSAGAAAQWARDILGLEIEAADALAIAADTSPTHVQFLPYLQGERSPFVDLDLRAGFIGLSAEDRPGDLYRAVLEGVALAIAGNLQAMVAEPGDLSLAGGGALSQIWPRLLADVIGRPISVPAEPITAASIGALQLALVALGRPSVAVGGGTVFAPRPERAERTARLKRRFAAATDFLRGLKDLG
ncbi:FGGY family carbohydrate kinase [Consotaella aegiceratis]|uniref:FGGY family carbohydrate kinase n=1 Tax=Consotaella aegiceratis TaxID=3097961 RepID=UPI002F41F84B